MITKVITSDLKKKVKRYQVEIKRAKTDSELVRNVSKGDLLASSKGSKESKSFALSK